MSRLGQAGVTITSSPACTRALQTNISPLTLPEVTAMRYQQCSVDGCGCRLRVQAVGAGSKGVAQPGQARVWA